MESRPGSRTRPWRPPRMKSTTMEWVRGLPITWSALGVTSPVTGRTRQSLTRSQCRAKQQSPCRRLKSRNPKTLHDHLRQDHPLVITQGNPLNPKTLNPCMIGGTCVRPLMDDAAPQSSAEYLMAVMSNPKLHRRRMRINKRTHPLTVAFSYTAASGH